MNRERGHERLRDHLLSLARELPDLSDRLADRARAANDRQVDPAVAWSVDAKQEAERLAGFAAYIDHYSRSEGSTLGPLDLRTVLEHAVALTRGELEAKASVTTSYLPAPLVRASSRQLGQVFISLLINAAQATPAGARDSHHIAVELDTSDTGWARVAIADTGTGIPAEVLPRIFEPLYSTKRGAGMGVGLALVRELLDAVGGRISVESEPGRGTLFILELPPAP
jgi:signal transduction histidine kinase